MSGWEAVADEFEAVEGVWLDTAHQGPLPGRAVRAANEAAARKANPIRMAGEAFSRVPEDLRVALARLVGASADEIVLGNSTSHGLHLVANGLDWALGDEVVTVEGDYPATVLPWRRLRDRGVIQREVGRSRDGQIDLDHLSTLLGPRCRLIAVTWVDSFTGVADDVAAIARVCHEHDALCVVNGSQAVGAREVDVSQLGVDALVSCGYKWLCGPYGTGFAWLSPSLRDRLVPQQAYWLANPAGADLQHMRDHTIRDDLGVRGFDVFCTANFLGFQPWLASLELIHELGNAVIERHDQALVARLLDGLDEHRYGVRGPVSGPTRSTLVALEPRAGKATAVHQRLNEAGIATAIREGGIRISPHLFNSEHQIDATLAALHP